MSTKALIVPEKFEEVNKYFARDTTLLIIAAKTNSWAVVRAILESYPQMFETKNDNQKHVLYHQDDSKTSLVQQALEKGEIDILKIIITYVDVFTLKTIPVHDGKTLKKILAEKIKLDELQYLELLPGVEEKLAKKAKKRKVQSLPGTL